MLIGMDFPEESQKQHRENNFSTLPKDIQNEIIQQTWNSIDNHKTFEQDMLDWNDPASMLREQIVLEGHKGDKLPIYFYTNDGGKPSIRQVGIILNDAIPYSKIWGSASGAFKEIPQLFITAPDNKKYFTTLIDDDFSYEPTIKAACLSVTGNLALVWTDSKTTKNNTYVTILKLEDLIKNKHFTNIRPTAQKLSDGQFSVIRGSANNTDPVKGCLFMLDGSKLGVCTIGKTDAVTIIFAPVKTISGKFDYKSHIAKIDHAVIYFDIKQNKPLTSDEKAKRLGIFTENVTKDVQQRLKLVVQKGILSRFFSK